MLLMVTTLAARPTVPEPVTQRPAEHEAKRAFDALYVDHHPYAVRLATQLTGDRHRAEDIVADVFVKVYRRLQRGPIDQPKAYLRRAVINHRNSWFRRQFLERAWNASKSTQTEEAHRPSDQIADRDAILWALDQLTLRARQVLVLRYYEDLSVDETAAVLGIASGTVKTTAHRAMMRLRELLAEEWAA